jgi:hypothetical protein
MWIAVAAGVGVLITLVLSQILPGTKKGEWMGWVLLAYVVLMAFLLFVPAHWLGW